MAIDYNKYTIDLPFKFSSSGAVSLVNTSDQKYWRNKVLAVVNTNNNERIWYPVFGAALVNLTLFNNVEEATTAAYTAVSDAFVRWLPELTFIDLVAQHDSTTGILVFTVSYRLPNGNDDYVKISTQVVDQTGKATGVIYNG